MNGLKHEFQNYTQSVEEIGNILFIHINLTLNKLELK